MHTHRFGKRIKLPSTIAIKHQLRRLMFEDLVKEAELTARAEVVPRTLEKKTVAPGGARSLPRAASTSAAASAQ
jgi:hypothetical protein